MALPLLTLLEVEVPIEPEIAIGKVLPSLQEFRIECTVSQVQGWNLTFLANITMALNSLEITNCGLPAVPDFSLVVPMANSIDTLILTYNEFTDIPSNAFETLINLENVYLGHNLLNTIHPDAFVNQVQNLSLISLEYNYDLSIPGDFFQPFTALRSVIMTSTAQSEYPNLLNSRDTLQYVYLNHLTGNRSVFDLSKASTQYPHLVTLNLEASLDPYQPIPDISEFITANSLTSLNLRNNVIACSCETSWLLRMVYGSYGGGYAYVPNINFVTCNDDIQLFSGRLLTDISLSELCLGMML